MKKTGAYREKLLQLAFCAGIFAIFLFINLNVTDKFDDAAFRKSWETCGGDFGRWISFYWNSWSSRILCHGVAMLLLNAGKYAFALVNALMQTAAVLLIAGTAQTGADRQKPYLLSCGVFLGYLCLIPYEVRMESDLWQIASVIYLWGGVCALYCIRIFFAELFGAAAPGPLQKLLAVLAAVYASNCEQAAPLIIGFGIVCEGRRLLIKKERPRLFHLLLIGITALGFVLCLLAPGNAARSEAEILLVISFYGSMSLIEKGFFGEVAAVRLLTEQYALLLAGISLLLAAHIRRQRLPRSAQLLSLLPCGYFGLRLLFDWMLRNFPGQDIPFRLDLALFDILPIFPPAVSYAPNQWFSTLLGIFICCLLGAMLFLYLPAKERLLPGLFFGAAFADVIVIGFTVNGRILGMRTLFVPALLLLVCAARLAQQLYACRRVPAAALRD